MEIYGRQFLLGLLILVTSSLFCLESCNMDNMKPEDNKEGKWLSISTRATLSEETKSAIAEVTTFSFDGTDALGFFAGSILRNKKLNCVTPETGEFECRVKVSGESAESYDAISYYCYSPYYELAGNNPQALSGELSHIQRAPYDGKADYMVATPVVAKYDVEDFPSLEFVFSSHLFAIVKLTITNTSEEYAGEKLLSLGLHSNALNTLAGRFTFDATQPSMAPVFTEEKANLYPTVLAEFSDPPTLGQGKEHSVYVVIKAADYASGDLSLIVNTSHHRFTLDTKKDVILSANKVSVFPKVDLYTTPRIQERGKKLVLWGSSVTSSNYAAAVRKQLGTDWNVYHGGVGGNTMINTAARAGGYDIVTGATEFTFPESSETYVPINGLYIRLGTEGSYTYSSMDTRSYTNTNALVNPLVIDGIECEVVYDDVNLCRLRRLADGQEKTIAARTLVSTYGAREMADADIIVVQISYNDGGKLSANTLKGILDRVKAHLTKPNAIMFINGFLSSPTDFPQYWNETYSTEMTALYGDCFLDLFLLGGGKENAIPLMKEIGQITNEAQISDRDWEYLNRGEWPLSWFNGEMNVHPNSYGSTVMAILLRRRMAELNLL